MSPDRQRLIAQLVADEGLRLFPYVDTVGKLTIGCGRNLSDVGISNAEAMTLLDHDVDACITDLAGSFPWFVKLDAVRQRVIVNMRFNLGPAGFRSFKRMVHAVALGQYALAAEHMRGSKWASQVKGRAYRLAQAMETGIDPYV